MKSCLLVVIIVIVMLCCLSCFSTAEAASTVDPRVSFVRYPADYLSVGGYSAWIEPQNAFALGDHALKQEHYSWSAWDLFWPGKECVTVGPRVDRITLFFKDGYRWENHGSEYCLVKD